MTDKKPSTYTLENPKSSAASNTETLFAMRLVQQPILPQDVYSANEVVKLLNISKKRVYRLATNPHNPLPLRRWPNKGRGSGRLFSCATALLKPRQGGVVQIFHPPFLTCAFLKSKLEIID